MISMGDALGAELKNQIYQMFSLRTLLPLSRTESPAAERQKSQRSGVMTHVAWVCRVSCVMSIRIAEQCAVEREG